MGSRLVATAMTRHRDAVAAALVEPPAGVDYLELRLDALPRPTPEEVAALLRLPRAVPVIATCRAPAQGGLFEGDERDRLALLAAAGEAGADLLDVEDTCLDDFPASVPGERIASCHLTRFVPRLEALARRVAGHDTRFAKLAVPAATPRHLAALLDLQEQLPESLAVVPTGRLAEAGRVMAAGRGSPLTYGALRADDPGHPDQPVADRLHDVYAVSLVGPATRFFAVVGHPVAHSLSPDFHNVVLRGVAQNARLVVMDVDRLPDVLALADALRLDGAAVTHPFKHDAVALAQSALPGARTTGAANTLVRTPAGWQARNTDWKAACDLMPRLLAAWRRDPEGSARWAPEVVEECWAGRPRRRKAKTERRPRVLLLGAGGAARAVAVSLFEEEVDLSIWSRNPAHAADLAERLADTLDAEAVDTLADRVADVVVNATPVGMPGADASAMADLGPACFAPGGLAIDLNYGVHPSVFRDAAGRAGVPILRGETFFGLQARRQAEIFTGGAAGADLCRRAAERCGVAS